MSDGAIVPKICSMILLGFGSGIAGTLPIRLKSYCEKNYCSNAKFERAVSFLTYFGGGVLLSTIFLHLLPEVRKGMLEVGLASDDTPISYPELVVCVGFFAILCIEELSAEYASRWNANPAGIDNPMFECKEGDCIKCDHKNYNACQPPALRQSGMTGGGEHDHGLDVVVSASSPSWRSLVVVLALSVHELFEGLAVGLEREPVLVWYLLAAVSCHKLVLAVCMGVQLVQARIDKRVAYGYAIFFAMTSPLGIGCGIALSAASTGNDDVAALSSILQGLATGSLVYVVFFVVLKHVEKDEWRGFFKLLPVALGYTLMVAMQVLLTHFE